MERAVPGRIAIVGKELGTDARNHFQITRHAEVALDHADSIDIAGAEGGRAMPREARGIVVTEEVDHTAGSQRRYQFKVTLIAKAALDQHRVAGDDHAIGWDREWAVPGRIAIVGEKLGTDARNHVQIARHAEVALDHADSIDIASAESGSVVPGEAGSVVVTEEMSHAAGGQRYDQFKISFVPIMALDHDRVAGDDHAIGWNREWAVPGRIAIVGKKLRANAHNNFQIAWDTEVALDHADSIDIAGAEIHGIVPREAGSVVVTEEMSHAAGSQRHDQFKISFVPIMALDQHGILRQN